MASDILPILVRLFGAKPLLEQVRAAYRNMVYPIIIMINVVG